MIVGAGFAGYNAARELSRVADASTDITVLNSTDYFLYLPLLPQVGAGLVEPRHICSVTTALDGCWVQLSTGEKVATHSLIWCVGVRADPLMAGLDLDTSRGAARG